MKYILSSLVVTALVFGCESEQTVEENNSVPISPTTVLENQAATAPEKSSASKEQAVETPKTQPVKAKRTVVKAEPTVVAKQPTAPKPAQPVAPTIQAKKTNTDESIQPTLTLVHAANLQGEIEPCGWAKAQLGGLARRATIVAELNKKNSPVLHFDAGDAFFARYSMTDKDAKQVEDIALLYVRSFNRMNLQAYTIGDRDLVLGISKLKQLQKKAKFPLLSVNILDDKDQPVFQPSTVLNSGGIKIGIIGATTALLVNRQKVESEHKLNVEKPVLAIRREVAKLKKQGVGLFILLSHLNQTEITEVGRLVPEIQIVLGGQDMRMEHTLKRVGSALVGNGYMKGKYLSIMDLMVQNQSLKFVDRNARTALEGRKVTLQAQLRSRERSLERSKESPDDSQRLEMMKRLVVQAKTEIQELDLELEETQAPDAKSSFIQRRMKALHKDIADDAECAKLVTAYRKIHPDPKKRRTPNARPLPHPVNRRPASVRKKSQPTSR